MVAIRTKHIGLWRCPHADTKPKCHGIIQFHRLDIYCFAFSFFFPFLLSHLNQVDFFIFIFVAPGIAIYFLSPLWPYTVNTAVSLDYGPITLIDLVDHSRPNTGQGPETVQYQVVWNATGLANTQHNLLISVGAGQPYAIVNGLMYVLFFLFSPSRTLFPSYAC